VIHFTPRGQDSRLIVCWQGGDIQFTLLPLLDHSVQLVRDYWTDDGRSAAAAAAVVVAIADAVSVEEMQIASNQMVQAAN
jgi:hypothetical protein